MNLWQSKHKPWKHISTMVCNYEKMYFFRFKRVPNNKWLKMPRFHTMVNLFLISIWRDNINFRIGIGLGKKHYCITFNSIF